MKKTIITLTAVIVFASTVNSQKPSIGFTAGGTLSNYHIKENGEDNSSNSKLGFTAGIIVDIPAGKNFVVQTGAHWAQKGTKDEEGGDKVSLTVNSIEVPVNFLYKSRGGFFAGAGPSLSYAVSGKWKLNDLSVSVKFGDTDDDDMRRFDFGANLVAGYQFPGGILVMANFNEGFSNLMAGANDNSDSKLTSHYFGIRVGYLLKKKK